MYRLLLFSLVLASLLGCSSDSDNDIQDPVLPPSVLNTGKLLSIDGGQLHIAFSYDTQGRVTTFERFDSTYISVRKHQAGYKYEGNRIFIEYEEFEELPDGERDPSSGRDIMRHEGMTMSSVTILESYETSHGIRKGSYWNGRMRMSQKRHWHPPPKKIPLSGVIAIHR